MNFPGGRARNPLGICKTKGKFRIIWQIIFNTWCELAQAVSANIKCDNHKCSCVLAECLLELFALLTCQFPRIIKAWRLLISSCLIAYQDHCVNMLSITWWLSKLQIKIQGPFHQHRLTEIRTCTNFHTHCFVLDITAHCYTNSNCNLVKPFGLLRACVTNYTAVLCRCNYLSMSPLDGTNYAHPPRK